MNKTIYIILGIVTTAFIVMMGYMIWTGKNLFYAQYYAGGVALLSLWISALQFLKNEEGKRAKLLVEILEYPSNPLEAHYFRIRNNSGFPMFHCSLTLSKELFVNNKPINVQNIDLNNNECLDYLIEYSSSVANRDNIDYEFILGIRNK